MITLILIIVSLNALGTVYLILREKSMANDITTIQAEIVAIQSDLADETTALNNLSTEIGSAITLISGLKGQVLDQATIDSIVGSLTTVDTGIKATKDTITSANTSLTNAVTPPAPAKS